MEELLLLLKLDLLDNLFQLHLFLLQEKKLTAWLDDDG